MADVRDNSSRPFDLKFAGLFLDQNQFSSVPEGSLTEAKNVVIDFENQLSLRRGFERYNMGLPVSVSPDTLFSYTEMNYAFGTDSKLYRENPTNTWTALTGTFVRPSSFWTTFESNKNVYWLTTEGQYKLDSNTVQPRIAGAPRGISTRLTLTGVSGYLEDDTAVAYRIVWGYSDLNNNLILGVPSERVTLANTTGSAKSVNVAIDFPAEIDENWFFQVYRSPMSATAADVPSDELQLVYEAYPTAPEVVARQAVWEDIIPEVLLGAALYTSPSQQGIAAANWRAPYALDAAPYKGHTFLANCRLLQSQELNVIAAGSSPGIIVGTTLIVTDSTTLSTFTITAAAAENVGANEFKVFSAGTPSENIENTALSIARVLTLVADNDFVDCYYVSGTTDIPGRLQFLKRTLDSGYFYLNSNTSTCWNNALEATGSAWPSTAESRINRVYISNFQQPEAYPLSSYLDIGSANAAILRIIALRDGILVFKKDGVWRISGNSINSFIVSLFDGTSVIRAPRSAAVLNNLIFYISEQGVVAASDNSIAIISRPIENELLRLANTTVYPAFETTTFGVSYESERKYILFMQTVPADPCATQAFVYNSLTQSWVRWVKDVNCAFVNPVGNKLHMGAPYTVTREAGVYIERKRYDYTDYADESFSRGISVNAYTTFTLDSTAQLQTGDVIVDTIGRATILTVLNGTQVSVEQDIDTPLVGTGAVTVYRPIPSEIQTAPQDFGNPGMLKQIRECSLIFNTALFDEMELSFITDITQNEFGTTIYSKSVGGWGTFPWGTLPWGGSVRLSQRIRAFVPQQAQRCNWSTVRLRHSSALETYTLSGMTFVITPMSERQK